MDSFPEFIKETAKRIDPTEQNTPDVEGYYYEGAGGQAAFWTCHSVRESKKHTHSFDEYMAVLSGEFTLFLNGEEIVLMAGDEAFIPAGTEQWGRCAAGTRTVHAFGGKRIKGEKAPAKDIIYVPVSGGVNSEEINRFIYERWFGFEMAIRGRLVDMTKADGIAAYGPDNKITGLVTYAISNSEFEILSLDSVYEGQGIGTRLLDLAFDTAKQAYCRKVTLITTNDNIKALSFYQKRGFTIAAVYPGAVTESRKLKPSIPLVGDNGIPIRDEIELEKML